MRRELISIGLAGGLVASLVVVSTAFAPQPSKHAVDYVQRPAFIQDNERAETWMTEIQPQWNRLLWQALALRIAQRLVDQSANILLCGIASGFAASCWITRKAKKPEDVT